MIRWILWLDVLAVFLVIAICDLNLTVHLALGRPRAWLLFILLVLLLAGTLFLAYYLFVWRPLRTARRIGPAPHLSTIMFIADRYAVRTLIVWMIFTGSAAGDTGSSRGITVYLLMGSPICRMGNSPLAATLGSVCPKARCVNKISHDRHPHFGRDRAEPGRRYFLGRPETFNFLDFTFICSKSRPGKFETKRGQRGWHARKEWTAKARNHPRVASALPHSEGTAYKPSDGEIAVCPRVDGVD
jgi:hypothetical protein